MPLSGTIDKKLSAHRELSGDLSFSGALQESTAFKRAFGGILSFSGDLSAMAGAISISGILGAFKGVLSLKKNGIPVVTAATFYKFKQGASKLFVAGSKIFMRP